MSALSKAAALLGAVKSKKKAAASRRNGKMGGRPKKERPELIQYEDVLSLSDREKHRKNPKKFQAELHRRNARRGGRPKKEK